MDSISNDDSIDFKGVQEIVSSTWNAARIATWTVAIIDAYLILVGLLLFLNYLPQTLQSISQFIIVVAGISIVVWLFTYCLHNSGYFGNITLNSDIAYRGTSDLFASGFGGSVFSQIERNAGYLRISKVGISGIISIPWTRVARIEDRDNTTARIQIRSLWASEIVLRFQTNEDCRTFVTASYMYHHPTTP